MLDRKQAIRVLNDALATEYMCVLRYRFHYFMATGINSSAVAEEFMEHAREEQDHADQLAERIKQLGGKLELHPSVIAEHSHSEYWEGTSLADMIREDLIAERIAIETYREMVRYFGAKDTTSPSHAGKHLGEGRRACGRTGGPAACCATGHQPGFATSYFSDETPERELVRS
jgi:bacterioferritin (cytochrome b1)